jgi:peptide methionine sulfoxide reductase msrA/msrB
MKKILILLFLLLPLFAKEQTIVLGAGCFWGVEKHFSQLPGVRDVAVGYAGGEYADPNYKKVLAHRKDKNIKNHAEVVKVVYDDATISTEDILKEFWEMHDPSQGNRQGNDVGNNYRSIILYTTPEQKALAYKTKDIYQKLLKEHGYGTITTEIEPLKKFYKAEEYHQDYLLKNPFGYCPNHATGVKFTQDKSKKEYLTPLGGKEIIVIESAFCPFCKAFKKDVVQEYHASVPLRTTTTDKLKGFDLKTKIVATPTILFIEDGKEKFAHVGYMDAKSFYKALGAFKLGKESEAYDVAFHKATESRYCKQYDIFKHTPDGVFVDKISGDILFDTRDRFNSGSGWLSFYKAVDGAVVEKEDNSYGMHRTEILAKKSGAHLGHLFHDAPNGRDRYCINATVLEFVKREDIAKWKEQWKESH